MELTWRHWFEIGHDTIDFEHKIFFSLIHKLQNFADEERPKDALRAVLEEIIKYADFHFTSEEHIMIEAEYAGYGRHKAIHQDLMIRLREFVTMYDADACDAQEIVTFLFAWLLQHTINEDLNISKSVKEKMLRSFFKSA